MLLYAFTTIFNVILKSGRWEQLTSLEIHTKWSEHNFSVKQTCANFPQVRHWTCTKSSTSLRALWAREDSALCSNTRQPGGSLGQDRDPWGIWRCVIPTKWVLAHCFLFFCLGSFVTSASCDALVWKDGKKKQTIRPQPAECSRHYRCLQNITWENSGTLCRMDCVRKDIVDLWSC